MVNSMNTRRDEEGSIAIAMVVVMVATTLIVALTFTTYQNLRTSRRSGDSANALQVADAGVNAAIKAIPTSAPSVGVCSRYPSLPGFTQTGVVASGSYNFCAAQDTGSGAPVWHVDSYGTDQSGAQRHVVVDSVAQSLFTNAIVVISSSNFAAGFTVDSFSGEGAGQQCTGLGTIGVNDPTSSTFSFGTHGGGKGVTNCGGNYPVDGCVAYSADGSVTVPASAQGQGQCPPTNVTSASPEFSTPTPTPPIVYDYPSPGTGPGGSWTCNSGSGSSSLSPGKTYYFTNVTLGSGCDYNTTPSAGNPSKIYASNVTISGSPQPSGNGAGFCAAPNASPAYCPGFSGLLQMYVLGNGSVTFNGNQNQFWGVLDAPSSAATWSNGSPQWDIYGSMIINSVSGGTQSKWHYDENLASITTSRFVGKNWHEDHL